jgi:hypothetical protein
MTKIDYNYLFFRDKSTLSFIYNKTGKEYSGYISTVIDMKYSIFGYSISLLYTDAIEIYKSLEKKSKSEILEKIPLEKCCIKIKMNINLTDSIYLNGYIQNFHWDDNCNYGGGFYDVLIDKEIITSDIAKNLTLIDIWVDVDQISEMELCNHIHQDKKKDWRKLDLD